MPEADRKVRSASGVLETPGLGDRRRRLSPRLPQNPSKPSRGGTDLGFQQGTDLKF
jgi:hypothetical protein